MQMTHPIFMILFIRWSVFLFEKLNMVSPFLNIKAVKNAGWNKKPILKVLYNIYGSEDI